MPDVPRKVLQFLDQVMPFLEASPAWFKIWIYGLILLNCATLAGMAIFYLVSREEHKAKREIKSFSIERPQANEEIPLGENQSWILEGNLPVMEPGDDLRKVVRIEVEVFKLPNREAILQDGKARISSLGNWRFESAKFNGEGSYEIVVTASLPGAGEVYRPLNVICVEKARAYRNSIERDRNIRRAPKIALRDRKQVSLPRVYRELEQTQAEFFQNFPTNINESLKLVNSALDTIDGVLPLFPDDVTLQSFRAYMFKNYAMVMEAQNRPEEFERGLAVAAKMFEAIREQDPNDENAWNGLGSVELLRRNPKKALQFIDRALEIRPDYSQALHDKELALRMLEKKP
jgi:tetratricopeptide (TPR) repeat protein